MFRPNVHKQTVYLGGRSIKLNICTRCLRTQSKAKA
jgi:ribosomal protein L28